MSSAAFDERVHRAVSGDMVALKLLLAGSSASVRQVIGRRVPCDLARVIDAEDVLQEADIEVFRRISTFTGRCDESFLRWRCAIAISRLRNAIRDHRAIKRGGGRAMAPAGVQRSIEDSTVAFLDLLPGVGKTASRSMMTKEMIQAVQAAVESLPERHREAISRIHFDGEPVRQVAQRMNCTERAIHGLCRRGIELLAGRIQPDKLSSRW